VFVVSFNFRAPTQFSKSNSMTFHDVFHEFSRLFHDLCKLANCAAAGQHVNQISITIKLLPLIYLAVVREKYKLQNPVSNHKISPKLIWNEKS